MANVSRRTALCSAAATALVGMGSKSAAGREAGTGVKSMTLEEFRNLDVPVGMNDLFHPQEGHSFMACHKEMREKHGIWIPELVPVFEKLDGMNAASS